MSYSSRFSIAMTAAAAIVAGLFASAPSLLRRIDAVALLPPQERPIRLDLRDLEPAPAPTPEREPVKRLVDAGAPTDTPAQDTDLISSQASRAQDMSEQQGDPNRPAAQEIDDFDQLSAPEVSPPVEQPEPTPVETESAEAAPESATPSVVETPITEPAPVERNIGAAAPTLSDSARPEENTKAAPPEKKVHEEIAAQEPAAPKPELQPFKVAQALPSQQVPVQELHAEKGREGGGATDPGFTSFEANKHALGEYMLTVRNRVERQWRTALHLRYTGASRTEAVIHCVIRPDGTLESVTIADAGDSLTYAVLCRDAVEKAGPFGAFPFDVPEIYRTDNLEINWKFSYM